MKLLLAALLLTAVAVAEPAGKPAWGDHGDGTYRNPILWADFNNPCVFKAGDAFYLTCASHHFMGMPLLKSKDLVNWTYAGRIYSRLGGVHADFTFPGKACSAGSQDGEVGFFRGTYYMFNWSTKYRGFVCKAAAPQGPWSEPVSLSEKIVGDFEDPCPFWDDDGKGYLFLLGNPGALRIYRLNDTFDSIMDQGTVLIDDIPPKGPQVFKRNGFYYISVASTGKNKDKAQYVYRSKSLYGPYESRKIFHAGKADINAAQGSLVEVSGDRWAFLHHDYNLFATYGRRLYLEPAGWTADGWPWIGVDSDGDGIGEPVGLTEPYAKPALPVQPIDAADPSDEFDAEVLGGQWAWNHDPDDARWSLTARPGYLRLTARHLNTQGGVSQFGRTKVNYREDHLLFAYNTLVQRLYGAESDIVTKLDTAGMIDGQRAGLIRIIYDYNRVSDRNILMAAFREEDVAAGKDVSGAVRLRQLVSKATGGQEKPKPSTAPVHANADGKPMRTAQPGTLTSADAKPQPLIPGAKLFTDRAYISAELPASLKNAHFLPVAMNGQKTIKCDRAGTVFFLTPVLERNRDTVAQALMDQGFEKVALPEVPLFNPGSTANFCTLFQKDCAPEETILIGKWAVPVFFP